MIKVILVDDHELVRLGVEVLLNAVEDLHVERVCSSGEEALDLVEKMKPDIVLMDINMPGMGGEEACRRILKNHPATKIIALSVCNNGPIPPRLMKMGVMGFLSKSCTVSETVKAIKTVMSGVPYICNEVTNNLVIDKPQFSPFDKLSHRESQVVNLILSGKSIKEMSNILVISDKTVNTYRYRIYEKLQVKNDVELTRLAIKYNLL